MPEASCFLKEGVTKSEVQKAMGKCMGDVYCAVEKSLLMIGRQNSGLRRLSAHASVAWILFGLNGQR